jgi:hypothetical protein
MNGTVLTAAGARARLASMAMDLEAFAVVEDAIVPCKGCGAARGVPCSAVDGEKWKPGWSHFGRRVSRLLRSAGGSYLERQLFEKREVAELRREAAAEQARSLGRKSRT